MSEVTPLPTVEDLTGELAAALEGALLESTPGSMSRDEARAVGAALARGEGFPETVAGRLGSAPACTLVTFDADRIQGWVFASERVPVAAGASKVLDNLNRAVREGEIVRELRSRNRGRGLQGVLYSAGGGGLLVADTHLSEEALEEEVQDWLEARGHGLGFTVVAQRLTALELRRTGEPVRVAAAEDRLGRFELIHGLGGALARLQVTVRRRKEEARDLPPPPSYRLRPGEPLERCPSCGSRPPAKTPITGDDPSFWCSRCRQLRDYWRQHGAVTLERDGQPLTFEDLAAASGMGRGYLSFLAVDGNSMGAVVQGVRTLLELRAFSEATTRIYQAARERVKAILPEYLEKGWEAEEAHLSLLSGGDEITLVLPASAAPRITVEVLRAIEEGFDQASRPGGLLAQAFAGNPAGLERLRQAGAGAGLVAAQSSFPVRLLRRYAGELQRRAKGTAASEGLRSALGWLLLTDSSPLPESVTAGRWGEEMSVDGFDALLQEVGAAMEAKLPRAALQRLLDQGRREEESIETLPPGTERDRVLASLVANFLRYQVARNRSLAAWWKEVGPPPEEGKEDPAVRWLTSGGVSRLERLAELWSLGPVPTADEAPTEVAP